MRVLLVSLVCVMFNLAPVSGAAEEPALSGEVLLKYGESAIQLGVRARVISARFSLAGIPYLQSLPRPHQE